MRLALGVALLEASLDGETTPSWYLEGAGIYWHQVVAIHGTKSLHLASDPRQTAKAGPNFPSSDRWRAV
jgi:hypothetical protein